MTSTPPVVVRNPNSGDGRRSKRAREIAPDRGYEVLDSDGVAHTIELASEAARRTGTAIACGGDGTLNKTVRGVLEAGRLEDASLGIVPAGTGNASPTTSGSGGSPTPSRSSRPASSDGWISGSRTAGRSSTPVSAG